MKAIKSLFTDNVYTKVEYVPNNIAGNRFHVYKRIGRFDTWTKIDERKTLDEAEELAKSRGDKVVYMGVYENGKKKGVADWEERPLKHSPEQVLELRRKSYENYKPELNRAEGVAVPEPKFVKAALNKETEIPVEVENKFVRRASKG
jgi:hypothetical protein